MPDVEFTNLLVVAVIALLAPLTLGLAPALRFPSVVLEIIAGVVVGPQVLGWVEVDVPVSTWPCRDSRSSCSWPAWRSTSTSCRDKCSGLPWRTR